MNVPALGRASRPLSLLALLLVAAVAGCDDGGSGGGSDGGSGGGSDGGGNDAAVCADQTFVVTASGATNYVVDGRSDPTLTLCRGHTYTFQVNALGHPFWIKTVRTTGVASGAPGVTNNGTDQGTVTYVVPSDAPSQVFYICQIHSAMSAPIVIP